MHAYERSTPVFNYTVDLCGPVHITIGDGGNSEGVSFLGPDRAHEREHPQTLNPTPPEPQAYKRVHPVPDTHRRGMLPMSDAMCVLALTCGCCMLLNARVVQAAAHCISDTRRLLRALCDLLGAEICRGD